MADKVKTIRQLKVLQGFVDGDDRTFTVDKPKATVTKADVKALETQLKYCVVGDKTGADFQKIKDAKIVEATTVYLDLTTA